MGFLPNYNTKQSWKFKEGFWPIFCCNIQRIQRLYIDCITLYISVFGSWDLHFWFFSLGHMFPLLADSGGEELGLRPDSRCKEGNSPQWTPSNRGFMH
uniref:Uncharacterized protein n=1 Tax=Solanum tuberosum TaxID=4113 RepID=M0ZVA8_SOLTU